MDVLVDRAIALECDREIENWGGIVRIVVKTMKAHGPTSSDAFFASAEGREAKMKRVGLLAVVTALGMTTFAYAQPDDPISGTWNVVTKAKVSSCSGPMQGAVYQWLVSNADGKLSVQVLGETAIPKMEGSFDGKKFEIRGTEPDRRGSGLMTHGFFLKLSKPGRLEGERIAGTGAGDDKHACGYVFSVVATKQ